jgi:hypothetical protein
VFQDSLFGYPRSCNAVPSLLLILTLLIVVVVSFGPPQPNGLPKQALQDPRSSKRTRGTEKTLFFSPESTVSIPIWELDIFLRPPREVDAHPLSMFSAAQRRRGTACIYSHVLPTEPPSRAATLSKVTDHDHFMVKNRWRKSLPSSSPAFLPVLSINLCFCIATRTSPHLRFCTFLFIDNLIRARLIPTSRHIFGWSH